MNTGRATYASFLMKTDYQRSVNTEPRGWVCDVPFDFGCIDAPNCMAAGSMESYEYRSMPGKFAELPTCVVRAA